MIAKGVLSDLPRWFLMFYPMAIAAMAIWFGHLWHIWRFYFAAGAVAIAWLGIYGADGYTQTRQHFSGLDQLSIGLFFFGCATLISLAKAGVLKRWIASLRTR